MRALLDNAPDRARMALTDGWRQLALVINRWPSDLIFPELLDEPPLADAVWRRMAVALIEEVRSRATANFLILGPAPYQRLDALAEWEPFADERIVYACHYYSPMIFTHQGAEWDKDSPWGRAADVPFPSTARDPALMKLARDASGAGDEALARELRQLADQACNASSINAEVATLARWGTKFNVPVMINEFGVLKGRVRPSHRLAWLMATRRAAETHGVGWTHWDYATAFGLFDASGALDDGVIHALFSP